MYELLIASYIVGSKFVEIFTSRELWVALNFTSSNKKFQNVASGFHEPNISFMC